MGMCEWDGDMDTHTHTHPPTHTPPIFRIMEGDLVSRLYRFLKFQPKKSQLLTQRLIQLLLRARTHAHTHTHNTTAAVVSHTQTKIK